MKEYQGELDAREKKFGIVVGRFNEFISKRLLEGAMDCLLRHGAAEENVEVAWVPGSFEIPMIAKMMAVSKRYNSLICLGALIRGSTPHFDYIAAEVSKGIAKISLETGVPASFGIITADTLEQAIDRAGTKAGNKGWQAALSAIEMANLIPRLGQSTGQ
ncbi:MAG: 6,7-dimethyl-8-ribityllumazine synthase [Actinomycetota bacterium]|nr:6,7-dimethyl-8-ribityllumazine synthase [Actinomycetota bacterium]